MAEHLKSQSSFPLALQKFGSRPTTRLEKQDPLTRRNELPTPGRVKTDTITIRSCKIDWFPIKVHVP